MRTIPGRVHASDLGTLGGLTQVGFRAEPIARKLLIVKDGEMAEWLKAHAWKAKRTSHTEAL
jgi:hypothetical protein